MGGRRRRSRHKRSNGDDDGEAAPDLPLRPNEESLGFLNRSAGDDGFPEQLTPRPPASAGPLNPGVKRSAVVAMSEDSTVVVPALVPWNVLARQHSERSLVRAARKRQGSGAVVPPGDAAAAAEDGSPSVVSAAEMIRFGLGHEGAAWRVEAQTIAVVAIVPVLLVIAWLLLPTRSADASIDSFVFVLVVKSPLMGFVAGLLQTTIVSTFLGTHHDYRCAIVGAVTYPLFLGLLIVIVGRWVPFLVPPAVILAGIPTGLCSYLMAKNQHREIAQGDHPIAAVTTPEVLSVNLSTLGKGMLASTVLVVQLLGSVFFGVYFQNQGTFMQVLLCALYPIGILVFKKALFSVSASSTTAAPFVINLLSTTFAAIPYRFIFGDIIGWFEFAAILMVELLYKMAAYPFLLSDWFYATASVAKTRAHNTVQLCGRARSEPKPLPPKPVLHRDVSVLFYVQSVSDTINPLAVLLLFSLIRYTSLAQGHFPGIQDVSDERWTTLQLFYLVAFLWEFVIYRIIRYVLRGKPDFQPHRYGHTVLRHFMVLITITAATVLLILFTLTYKLVLPIDVV